MADMINIVNYNLDLIKNDLHCGFRGYRIPGMDYLVKGESVDKRDFIFTLGREIRIFNYKGELIKTITTRNFGITDKTAWFKHATFLDNDKIMVFLGFNNGIQNRIMIFDRDLHIVTEYFPIYDNDCYKDLSLSIDEHSYLYFSDEHLMFSMNTDGSGRNPTERFFLQEQLNGEVVWEWDSLNHIDELYELIIRDATTAKGKTAHINCITQLDEDNLLLSIRNLGIASLNKTSKEFNWFISKRRNDFNFKDIPILQHDIVYLNDEHTRFATFNNNWEPNSMPISQIFTIEHQAPRTSIKRDPCSLNIYDLETKESKKYDLAHNSVPRQGNIVPLKDNVFDINYGMLFEYDETHDQFMTYGEMVEMDVETGEVYMTLRFPYSSIYSITRGESPWKR